MAVPKKPLIVQSDRTLFLEVDHPQHEEVRDQLLPFAELVKSPEHIHTYRITPISLWNAAAGSQKDGKKSTSRITSTEPIAFY